MSRVRTAAFLAAALLIVACNFPLLAPAGAGVPPTEQSPAGPTATNTSVAGEPATFTPIPATVAPTATNTPTSVPTPSTPQVSPMGSNVNCRSGPDTSYDSISVLMNGSTAQVAGRDPDGNWWYVHNPDNPGSFCWISVSVVTIAGPQGNIPVIAPPAAIVTDVSVDVSLPSTVYCGGPNPVEFSGTITTNGAMKVKYQWVITGNKQNTTSPQTLTFTKATTKDVPDPGAYNVDCGKYKVTLHVLSPNDTSAAKSFKVAQ